MAREKREVTSRGDGTPLDISWQPAGGQLLMRVKSQGPFSHNGDGAIRKRRARHMNQVCVRANGVCVCACAREECRRGAENPQV